MLDSVVKAKKNHYPQILLDEWKYEPKRTKMENFTDDDLEKVHLMGLIMKVIMTLMMNWNLTMRRIMNNFIKS